MSKIGLIWVGYGTADYVEPSLRPWIEAKRMRLGGNDFVLCAQSGPFEGFDAGPEDGTRAKLLSLSNDLDIFSPFTTPTKETEVRGSALRMLVKLGCETTWMVDSDEFYTTDEITRILAFMDARKDIAAFRGSLKNYVEANGQRGYLTEPFTPMRIHRVRYHSYVADGFYDDNGVLYRGTITRDFVRDIDLTVAQIPRNTAWVRHESWPSNARGKKKVEYQWSRWGSACSFAWDDSQGGLIFNPAVPAPEIAHD